MLLTKIFKFFKRLFGRVTLIILSVLLQVGWFALFMILLGNRYPIFAGIIRGISLVVLFGILTQRINPSYKLAWTLAIMIAPVIGFSLYLTLSKNRIPKKTRLAFERYDKDSSWLLTEDAQTREQLADTDVSLNAQSAYIRDYSGYPVYTNTKTEYFPTGDDLFPAMVRELQKAKHFIFLEYFIIDNGAMWGTILDILERKAAEGLDVRLIYDDVGSVNTLPARYYREIRERGIKCQVFNPFKPLVSAVMNNRDHRKIMVIDGNVGFTGGINLADEYINQKRRFGHWKDTGVMLKGEAVWNFTVMFLRMWDVITEPDSSIEPSEHLRPSIYQEETFEQDGFVQPYSDTPLDEETVGENIYLNIINRAERYIYIFSPYLIIDNEMMTALTLAAKSGIDVRIITPGVPDKKLVYFLSKSYYEQLMDAGVRIYEYSPGFLHAKCFVCDDKIATVGTINLDYRSLYMHFECGVWMAYSSSVMQVKEDILDTIEVSREVTREELWKNNLPMRLAQSALRMLAPML